MGTDDERPDGVDGETPFAAQDDLTVDAFQEAVQRALRDKLGDDDTKPAAPRSADEMVANVLSALTGKDAKSALAEVRDRLDNPSKGDDADAGADNVIDLAAARDARAAQQSAIGARITGALSQSFREFLGDYAQKHGESEQITLDATFLKDNGPQLLGNLFQSLAAAFMTPTAAPKPKANRGPVDIRPDGSLTIDDASGADADVEASADGDDADAPKAPQAASSEARDINVRFDVASLLAGLFKPRTPPSKP